VQNVEERRISIDEVVTALSKRQNYKKFLVLELQQLFLRSENYSIVIRRMIYQRQSNWSGLTKALYDDLTDIQWGRRNKVPQVWSVEV